MKQERRRLAVYGTDVRRGEAPEPPAHYFGVPVVGACTVGDLAKALHAALESDHLTVIEALVDPRHDGETVYD